jgi:hypothetical protein
MGRRLILLFALALAATTLRATPAQATPLWGIELYGGWSSYAMSDFNDSLASVNQALGSNFQDITSGAAGGFGVRVWPNENILLRLDFDALLADTKDSGVTFDVGPGGVSFGGTYFLTPEGTVRFGIGAGMGFYSIVGKVEGPGATIDTGGDVFALHGTGEAMVTLGPGFSLNGILGYRRAVADDLTFDDQSTNTEVDFSGLMIRVGFAYDWQRRVPK